MPSFFSLYSRFSDNEHSEILSEQKRLISEVEKEIAELNASGYRYLSSKLNKNKEKVLIACLKYLSYEISVDEFNNTLQNNSGYKNPDRLDQRQSTTAELVNSVIAFFEKYPPDTRAYSILK